MTHTKFSPSGSSKFLYCAGSLEKEKGYPNKSNPAADRGSCGHHLAQICYNEQKFPSEFLGCKFPEYKTVVDQDMINHVEQYLEYIRNLEHDNTTTFIETTFKLQTVYESETEEQGTADAVVVDYTNRIIHDIDLKLGGNRVFATDNSQLKIYGCGAINFLDFAISDIEEYDVHLHIFQPAIDNVDVVKTTVKELNQWMNDEVRPIIKLIEAGNAPVTPGFKQCQWCRARFDCVERAEWNISAVTEGFEDLSKPLVFKDKKALTNEDLGEILTKAKSIKAFLSDIEKIANAKALQGQKIKDHKIILSKKNEKLDDEEGLKTKLLDMGYAEDQFYKKPEIEGKTNLKKLLKTKGFKEVAQFWKRPPGDKILVHVSEKGEEVVIDPTEGFKEIES